VSSPSAIGGLNEANSYSSSLPQIGNTPLFLAVMSGKAEVVTALITAKAEVNSTHKVSLDISSALAIGMYSSLFGDSMWKD
jgi:hypothetical protein